LISPIALEKLQDAKKKKKSKDDSDEEKKKAKKEKKAKKAKKKENEGTNGDYIKEALAGGAGDDNGLAEVSDDDDSKSVDSEAGVDDEGALQLAVDATRKFLADNSDFTNQQLIEYVTNQQMASALKSQDKVHILVRAVFTDQVFKEKQVAKFAPTFASITNGNKIMERHLIAALEALCVDKPKNFAVMLKQFYDEDALEEETILEWADEGRSEYTLDKVDEDSRAVLRGEAEPVVVWLQEADSEDESGDED
jgi:translation initiation factor 5